LGQNLLVFSCANKRTVVAHEHETLSVTLKKEKVRISNTEDIQV